MKFDETRSRRTAPRAATHGEAAGVEIEETEIVWRDPTSPAGGPETTMRAEGRRGRGGGPAGDTERTQTAKPGAGGSDVRRVVIPPLGLAGMLTRPARPRGVVLVAHAGGSSRFDPRDARVAAALRTRGLATLLFDLLLAGEDCDRRNAFDVPHLAGRLADAIAFIEREPDLAGLPIGLFGAGTGGAVALAAAARRSGRIGAVVSVSGRPDLAGGGLEGLDAPILSIVGGADAATLVLTRRAFARADGRHRLEIVPAASRLFCEAGALDAAITAAADWFEKHLTHPAAPVPGAAGG